MLIKCKINLVFAVLFLISPGWGGDLSPWSSFGSAKASNSARNAYQKPEPLFKTKSVTDVGKEASEVDYLDHVKFLAPAQQIAGYVVYLQEAKGALSKKTYQNSEEQGRAKTFYDDLFVDFSKSAWRNLYAKLSITEKLTAESLFLLLDGAKIHLAQEGKCITLVDDVMLGLVSGRWGLVKRSNANKSYVSNLKEAVGRIGKTAAAPIMSNSENVANRFSDALYHRGNNFKNVTKKDLQKHRQSVGKLVFESYLEEKLNKDTSFSIMQTNRDFLQLCSGGAGMQAKALTCSGASTTLATYGQAVSATQLSASYAAKAAQASRKLNEHVVGIGEELAGALALTLRTEDLPKPPAINRQDIFQNIRDTLLAKGVNPSDFLQSLPSVFVAVSTNPKVLFDQDKKFVFSCLQLFLQDKEPTERQSIAKQLVGTFFPNAAPAEKTFQELILMEAGERPEKVRENHSFWLVRGSKNIFDWLADYAGKIANSPFGWESLYENNRKTGEQCVSLPHAIKPGRYKDSNGTRDITPQEQARAIGHAVDYQIQARNIEREDRFACLLAMSNIVSE